jgi:excisionase family DNA binding protein
MQINKEWYSVKQVAEYLNCSDRTVKRLIQRQQLQRKKVNGLNLIHQKWIDQMVLSNGSGKLSKRDKDQLQYLRMA